MLKFVKQLLLLDDKQLDNIMIEIQKALIEKFYHPYIQVSINKRTGEIIKVNLN